MAFLHVLFILIFILWVCFASIAGFIALWRKRYLGAVFSGLFPLAFGAYYLIGVSGGIWSVGAIFLGVLPLMIGGFLVARGFALKF